MKFLPRVIFIFFIGWLCLFCLFYLFMVTIGKDILARELEKITQKKVKIGYLLVVPPFNFSLRNVEIEDTFKAKAIFVSPSYLRLATGRLAFNSLRLVKPEFTYERFPSQADNSGAAVSAVPAGESLSGQDISFAQAPPKPQAKPSILLILKRIKIRGGKVNYIDHTIGKEGIRITVKDIDFILINLHPFGSTAITRFELKGKIPWQQGAAEGNVEMEGWIDLVKRNMEAVLKIQDIDGIYLYPYYSHWVDLEKARIQQARLNFNSNIHGINNNITAQCHLELSDIVRKPLEAREEEEKAAKIADFVFGLFQAQGQGKIALGFTINTRMDSPEFGFGNIKMAFEDKLAEARGKGLSAPQTILRLPVKLIEETVKSSSDLARAVVDGVFAVGNEVKKGVEGSFKKEKN